MAVGGSGLRIEGVRFVYMFDFRQVSGFVSRMDSTRELLKMFSREEQWHLTCDIWSEDRPNMDAVYDFLERRSNLKEVVERLSKLEANRRLRKRIDRIKSEFAKIDNYLAEKRDERDLSEEEYVRRWHRSKGWREEES